MGLDHNPLIREPVCIPWTPSKVTSGTQPSVRERKSAAGAAWSPLVVLWEELAAGVFLSIKTACGLGYNVFPMV